jgi:hypothetical protein
MEVTAFASSAGFKGVHVPGELQSLIDGQISKGGIGGRLVLPKRAFDIDETVHIASVRGLQVVGEGPWATELRWQVPSDTPMSTSIAVRMLCSRISRSLSAQESSYMPPLGSRTETERPDRTLLQVP